MTVKKITPVLFAATIEPCVRFWTDRLGFQKTVEVPEAGGLGFAILAKDGVELMYQSYASAEKDVPALADDVRRGPTFLYVEVDSLDAVIAAAEGAAVAIPVRTTFYGARELGVRDPAGHLITFAQMGAAAPGD
ncbi:MAG TPA: VOC family protein [Candidatus Acidoferrales bacterium]|nr:VOC family protein [Candidatus Acidoferrales bacterium]